MMERRSPSPGRAGRAGEQRAGAQRARPRRRQEERPRPAGRPGCLIFCQPPLINGPPSSSERAEPRSWQPGAQLPGGRRGLRKGYICTKCLGSAARRGCAGRGMAGAAGKPGGPRGKAAACGAAWVMGKFLWGAVLKNIRLHTGGASGTSVAARRPGREGAGIGAPRCARVLRPSGCPGP